MKISFKTGQSTILKIIKGADTKKKLKVFNHIEELEDKVKIKILLKVLEDSSWFLREKSAHRLAKFGGRVVPRLKKMCARGLWFSRAAACISLGEIGDLRALDSIIYLILNDKNPTVIKEASEALCSIAQKHPVNFTDELDKIAGQDKEKLLNIINKKNAEVYNELMELPINKEDGTDI